MQPNSYSNDPNYTQPNETNPPTPPYQQGGQYVQPPYQGQQGGPYTPPPYQGQQGQPVPPYQYTNQPPPVQQSSAMREGESRNMPSERSSILFDGLLLHWSFCSFCVLY